ncbi:prolipoprotein diacylglyceryl transferase [Corynebacterium poyangense]|uniref:Phosphatidylglycerol--prolipoprotein diacylglyceryl transferase n=1 Tax=Corynebacterium poyangense TaxID=2684405 RepID=A0A7H0SPN3_9CORY|nr:prolipoprotein diacylglyceryl transferase [Corynebacterium poyangense]MBZ8178095.1 prolipoprotein diacylglyceryl transferase [Corynebacterium poyangense]QNQ90508.1 prolipoprotein diacylglyceryl transferase [Corynebacterium poyangense]
MHLQNLAAIPSPPQGVWYLGPIPIRAYALCIIAGIVVALWITVRRYVARGGNPNVVWDAAIVAIPCGIIGGRLYHVITDYPKYFGPGAHPIDALKITNGGLGIWGAVALGGVGTWIFFRRKNLPLAPFADAIAPGIILAQGIGRLGNWFNQELYGRPTNVPWALEIYQRVDAHGRIAPLTGHSTGEVLTTVHPTFLYELLWNVLVFFILLWADRHYRLGHGRVFALYVALYTAGRFVVEGMRSDEATMVMGLRINTIVSAVVFIGAVIVFLLLARGRESEQQVTGGENRAKVIDSSEKAQVGEENSDSSPVRIEDKHEGA